MKTQIKLSLAAMVAAAAPVASAQPSMESAPPVVVRTVPVSGSASVDPSLAEIQVTYSKPMLDQSWSWSTWGEEYYPQTTGNPRYLEDERTCVLPVKLAPGRFYAIWLNSEKFGNFRAKDGQSAVPYLLTFRTAGATQGGSVPPAAGSAPPTSTVPSGAFLPGLNPDQGAVLAWTDRQFRSFFDRRTFDSWSADERAAQETKLIDSLKGPQSRDYFLAINTLGAMRSTAALPALREIAYDRADKNNRDRWMAIRSIGLIGDKRDVPELVNLVYHGNVNTRWWAQISLVKITGQNFGPDWQAWGQWWNAQQGDPSWKPEIIKWWSGQPADNELAKSLRESDEKFLSGLKPKPAAEDSQK